MAPSDKRGFDRRFFKSQEYLSSLHGSSGDSPPLTVSRLECWFYARRLQLQQRGVPFRVAHNRAIQLARYMERRGKQ